LDKNGGPTVTSSLLNPSVDVKESSKRYETSELHQFWIILKRALLFSRRDWVSLSALNRFMDFHLSYIFQTLMYLRLFAHILVGFLIGALYYDIGNDGAKVLSNLGFLFFNMLFLMYTSMTVTILSCKFLLSLLTIHVADFAEKF
jgi:ATP-binding cassette, subfamily G (WHITE), member 1